MAVGPLAQVDLQALAVGGSATPRVGRSGRFTNVLWLVDPCRRALGNTPLGSTVSLNADGSIAAATSTLGNVPTDTPPTL